ncbi:sugar O-acetyltransferase [Streptomyces alkaliterrae]|nr:sugar O-acetyltransferase [Streptomyces alkaliterrae]
MIPERLRSAMASGEPYPGFDPAFLPQRQRCMELLDRFNSTALPDFSAREKILRDLLGAVGSGGWVMPRFLCEFGSQIQLGDRVRINFDTMLLDCAPIVVGDDAMIGPGCRLFTGDHDLDPVRRREGWERAGPITLGADVWLGGGTTVLPGVTVGAGTVVGAGSVVTKDLPAGVLAVGNPARIVREL